MEERKISKRRIWTFVMAILLLIYAISDHYAAVSSANDGIQTYEGSGEETEAETESETESQTESQTEEGETETESEESIIGSKISFEIEGSGEVIARYGEAGNQTLLDVAQLNVVEEGQTLTLKFVPEDGYVVGSLLENNNYTFVTQEDDAYVYEISNYHQDTNYRVTFIEQPVISMKLTNEQEGIQEVYDGAFTSRDITLTMICDQPDMVIYEYRDITETEPEVWDVLYIDPATETKVFNDMALDMTFQVRAATAAGVLIPITGDDEFTVKIDKNQPNLKIDLNGYEGKWTNESVVIGFSNDTFQISDTFYEIKETSADTEFIEIQEYCEDRTDLSWEKETNRLIINADAYADSFAQRTYALRAVSGANLSSGEIISEIKIDRSKPAEPDIEVTGSCSNNWYNHIEKITIQETPHWNGKDGSSNTLYYRIYLKDETNNPRFQPLVTNDIDPEEYISEDGIYRLEVLSKDEAGNMTEKSLDIHFAQGKNAKITYSYYKSEGNILEKTLGVYSFHMPVIAKVIVDKSICPIKSISIYADGRNSASTLLKTINYNSPESKVLVQNFIIFPQFEGKIYIEAIDLANNVICSTPEEVKDLLLETEKPSIDMDGMQFGVYDEDTKSFQEKTPNVVDDQSWYCQDLYAKVVIQDKPGIGSGLNPVSGLHSVSASVNGNAADVYVVRDDKLIKLKDILKTDNGQKPISKNDQDTIKETDPFEIYIPVIAQPKSINSIGEYRIDVQATDNACNFRDSKEENSTRIIYIDTAVPEIKVTARSVLRAGQTKSEIYSGGWTAGNVEVTLSNQNLKSISNLTYYVKKKGEQVWSKLKKISSGDTLTYTIKADSETVLTDTYQFMVLSEAAALDYEEQVWVGKPWIYDNMIVKIDKQRPKNASVSLNPGKANGNKSWYKMKRPQISIVSPKDDGGSPIYTYYKFYNEGVSKDKQSEIRYTGKNAPVIKKDGIYILEVRTEDAVGNKTSVTYKKKIKVDATKPVISKKTGITYTSKPQSLLRTILNYASFNYFCKKQFKVQITASDNCSEVAYIVYRAGKNGKEKKVAVNKNNQISFNIPQDFKGNIYTYVIDKAGNSSSWVKGNGLVNENQKPSVTMSSDKNNEEWQNSDVTFEVEVLDNGSGIAGIQYIINGEESYRDFTKKKNIVYNDITSITASQEAMSSAGYTVEVIAEDNSGNITRASKNVYIRKTAPAITLSGIEADSYNNTVQTLQVAIEEKIYDKNQVEINVEKTLDGETSEYTLNFNSYDVKSIQSYDFDEDGFYKVTVSAAGPAGNRADEQTIQFTIDRTAPEIEIAGPEQDSFHKNSEEATIKVTESFFETNEVNIQVIRKLEEQSDDYDMGTWKNTGKVSELSHEFSKDGTYTIYVSAKDRAGNNAERKTLTFTIDKTPPKLAITGVDDYQVTGKQLDVTFEVTEVYYDTNSVDIRVNREDVEGKITPVELEQWENQGKNSALSTTFIPEGIYTATIRAQDKAGNSATLSKTFTINTSSPVIRYVDELDGRYMKSFKLEYDINDMIVSLTVPTYQMYFDGVEYDGVTEITSEGKHVFKIDVEDEVQNKATAKAEIIIDNTPPKVLFDGMDSENTIYEPIDLTVTLEDKEDMITAVRINGKVQDFDKKNMSFNTKINTMGIYTIVVDAADYAGNLITQTCQIEYKEKSVIRKFMENKPALTTSICGAGALSALGLLLFKRKTKL